MPSIDFGNGPVEFRCTARTLTIYEQAFHNDPYERVTGDLIADVFGKRVIDDNSMGFKYDENGNISALIVDLTADNWMAEKRALWAMLKTQNEIDVKHGEKPSPMPSYAEWDRSLVEWEPNMREVSNLVIDECNRGLFRAGAAASE